MSESTTIAIRLTLELKLKRRLDKLTEVTHRSKSFLAAEAVREYLELNEWQIKEIETAINKTEAGDFAPEEEIKAIHHKWGMSGD